VLLRLSNLRGVDLSLFDFDYDMQWQAMFLTPNGDVLGRFGGRDPEMPAKYLTLAGLRHSLAAALKASKNQSPQRKQGEKPVLAEEYPAAAEKRPGNACIHCHHVYELRRDQLQRDKRWSLDGVWVYPQPENLGLSLEVEQGNRVVSVAPKSAAAKIGMTAKDVLNRINETPIASVADVQYALHRAPKAGTLTLVWQRGAETRTSVFSLAEGWKKTDVSWRWSLKSLAPNPSIIGDDLDLDGRKVLGLDAHQLAYRHMNFLTPTARHAGLQANDVIVGVEGKELAMTARQFEAHIRLSFRPGQEIALKVLRGKDKITLKMKLPE